MKKSIVSFDGTMAFVWGGMHALAGGDGDALVALEADQLGLGATPSHHNDRSGFVKQNVNEDVESVHSLIERIISESLVTIETRPLEEILVYAIEERLPIGVFPSSISEGGIYDVSLRKVKWGPFFDSLPRSFSYAFEVADGSSNDLKWEGVGSFDGTEIAIGGDDRLDTDAEPEPGVPNPGVSYLPPTEYLPAEYVSGVIEVRNDQGQASVIVSWPASPSLRYQIEVAESIEGAWSPLEDGVVSSVVDVGEFEIEIDPVSAQFFRVRVVDDSAPDLRPLYPSQGDLGVGRFDPLRLRVFDENDIDLSSIQVGLPSGEWIDLKDSRLEYANGELRYAPSDGAPLGPGGGDLVFVISMSDRLGNGVSDFEWVFSLETPVVIADGAMGIGQPFDRAFVRLNVSETTSIVDADAGRIVIAYAGEAPELEVGQLLWSNDPAYPYYWRVRGVQIDALAETVTVDAVPARLEEIIEQGSFNSAQVVEIDPLTNAPLNPAADLGFSIGAPFQFGDAFTQVIFDDPDASLSTSIDWSLQGAIQVAGVIQDSELRKLIIRSPQAIDVTATSTLWSGGAVSLEDLVGKGIPTSFKIFERSREFVTWVGAVPVWLELNFAIEGG